jgi:hypothetical protein
MTLDQINAFVAAVSKRLSKDALSFMDQVRFAYHAEQKDYTKQTRQLRREIE